MNSYSTRVKHGGGQRRQLEKYRTGHVNLPLRRKKRLFALRNSNRRTDERLDKTGNLVSANLAKTAQWAHSPTLTHTWPI